ncbi:hypothetical protein [Streptomyces sp. NBC_00887]|uniref:hypothetical protein n=1 Tax=Streptomyces sp. NBC_00887 TaxID=2975859 RepID=UPI003864708D|nr:hypothetical protein OG844_28170 [Streptomyces sp. NBC_00887]
MYDAFVGKPSPVEGARNPITYFALIGTVYEFINWFDEAHGGPFDEHVHVAASGDTVAPRGGLPRHQGRTEDGRHRPQGRDDRPRPSGSTRQEPVRQLRHRPVSPIAPCAYAA